MILIGCVSHMNTRGGKEGEREGVRALFFAAELTVIVTGWMCQILCEPIKENPVQYGRESNINITCPYREELVKSHSPWI